MKLLNFSKSISAIIALAGVTTLAGCSGPTEDVRLTLCKKLATTFAESPQAVEWGESKEKFARFEDLITTVNFDYLNYSDESVSMQASCYYEYDENLIDEDVSHDVDPLSTYKTVPYKMILDGEVIEQPTFEKVVHLILLDQVMEAVEFLKKEMKRATQKSKTTPI